VAIIVFIAIIIWLQNTEQRDLKKKKGWRQLKMNLYSGERLK
jgi:hypothetical protein